MNPVMSVRRDRRVAVAVVSLVLAAAAVGWRWDAVRGWSEPVALSVADVRHVWAVDLPATAQAYRGEFGPTMADVEELGRMVPDLRIDLTRDLATISCGTATWTGQWTTSPASGKAEAIEVQWTPMAPALGVKTVFSRFHGRIAIFVGQAKLMLRRGE